MQEDRELSDALAEPDLELAPARERVEVLEVRIDPREAARDERVESVPRGLDCQRLIARSWITLVIAPRSAALKRCGLTVNL